MVTLYLDRPQYFNDVGDELRLFLRKEKIEEAELRDSADCAAVLTKEAGVWRAEATVKLLGKCETYIYEGEAAPKGTLEEKRIEKRFLKIAMFRALEKLFGFTPPWGSLTGIRPTRLLFELASRHGMEKAIELFKKDFDVSEEKIALAREIVSAQQPIMATLDSRSADAYVNIPFCLSKCLYCSFPSEVRTKKTDMAGYLDTLMLDIDAGARILREGGYNVRSIYVGGGTPTALDARELERVLMKLVEAYGAIDEFTVEAGRPDTITRAKLVAMWRAGVTRISVNPQTMNDSTLALIGRSHTAKDVATAYDMARELGFDNINMDVIAGLPGEGEREMETTLCEIEKLAPESLTVHTLALKRTSRLVTEKEVYKLPEAETVEKMVRMGEESARGMGMRPYYMYRQKYMSGNLENVGYSKRGLECIYNIDMMEDASSVMAAGAGAMTKRIYDAELRVERVPSPKEISVYRAKLPALIREKEKLYLN